MPILAMYRQTIRDAAGASDCPDPVVGLWRDRVANDVSIVHEFVAFSFRTFECELDSDGGEQVPIVFAIS